MLPLERHVGVKRRTTIGSTMTSIVQYICLLLLGDLVVLCSGGIHTILMMLRKKTPQRAELTSRHELVSPAGFT
jgi:hypothetical protein